MAVLFIFPLHTPLLHLCAKFISYCMLFRSPPPFFTFMHSLSSHLRSGKALCQVERDEAACGGAPAASTYQAQPHMPQTCADSQTLFLRCARSRHFISTAADKKASMRKYCFNEEILCFRADIYFLILFPFLLCKKICNNNLEPLSIFEHALAYAWQCKLLHQIRREERASGTKLLPHTFVWKDVAPQHFTHVPSGRFEWGAPANRRATTPSFMRTPHSSTELHSTNAHASKSSRLREESKQSITHDVNASQCGPVRDVKLAYER